MCQLLLKVEPEHFDMGAHFLYIGDDTYLIFGVWMTKLFVTLGFCL